jgi:uncharacterized iron-regulated membrane protein
MGATVRESLNWLHTWTGLVVGVLLFAVFWTGTICVFDREIDRWMMPSTRLVYAGAPVAVDGLREEAARLAPPGAPWAIGLPSPREPFVWIGYRAATGIERKLFDPVSLAPLADPETWAATRFFFPFHYTLHINAWDIGLWLVGFAGMAMLALCVSGVIIHRRIFADFFTLRRSRRPQRLLLDLHNVAGVLGFVFYVAMAFSGVTIFASVYFPSGVAAAFEGGRAGYVRDTYDMYTRPPAGTPGGSVASFDAMLATTREAWGGLAPRMLRVLNPGDTNAVALDRDRGRDAQRSVLFRRDHRRRAAPIHDPAGDEDPAVPDRAALRAVPPLGPALGVLPARLAGLCADRHRSAVLDRIATQGA